MHKVFSTLDSRSTHSTLQEVATAVAEAPLNLVSCMHLVSKHDLAVSENRGPQYNILNSRILITRSPKYGTPNFRKLPFRDLDDRVKASPDLDSIVGTLAGVGGRWVGDYTSLNRPHP